MKYRVTIPETHIITIVCEAKNKAEAIEKANNAVMSNEYIPDYADTSDVSKWGVDVACDDEAINYEPED